MAKAEKKTISNEEFEAGLRHALSAMQFIDTEYETMIHLVQSHKMTPEHAFLSICAAKVHMKMPGYDFYVEGEE